LEIKIFSQDEAFFEVIAQLLLRKITKYWLKRLSVKWWSYFLLVT